MILSVANPKGGAGKSTLASNVAARVQSLGGSVLLMDTDPQGTSLAFASVREPARQFPAIPATRLEGLSEALEEADATHSVVVIDTAGRDNGISRLCIAAAEIVVVPVEPQAPAIWALTPFLKSLRDVPAHTKGRTIWLVANRVTHTKAAADALQAFHEDVGSGGGLGGSTLRIARSQLFQRTAWAQAYGEGLGVSELIPSVGGLAAYEFAALLAEVELLERIGL